MKRGRCRRMEEDGGGWRRMEEDGGGWRRMEHGLHACYGSVSEIGKSDAEQQLSNANA
jgi:hypothetical protein